MCCPAASPPSSGCSTRLCSRRSLRSSPPVATSSRRAADEELGRQHHALARALAAQAHLEQLERPGSEEVGVERDGSERRLEYARELHVVEADHRELVRDLDAALAR